jgi:hypothetical protein
LQKVLIAPKTGELALPGDYEKLQALKEAIRAQEHCGRMLSGSH